MSAFIKLMMVVESHYEAYGLFRSIQFESQEVVRVLYLDCQNNLLQNVEIFRGTLNASLARPREILREGLVLNAAKFLVAHNHPSQTPEPSEDDWYFTRQLKRAAAILSLTFLDHLLVVQGGYFSFARKRFYRATDAGISFLENVLLPKTR